VSELRSTDLKTWLRAEWDRVAGVAAIVVGALALYLGYRGVSRSGYLAAELAYVVSGGIGGVFLLGLGALFLLRGDLHDHWRQLDRIEAAIRRQPDPTAPPQVPAAPPAKTEVNGNGRANGSTAARRSTRAKG
jgi:hypothetical protein